MFDFRACLNCGSFFALSGQLCAVCQDKITHSNFFGIQQSVENDLNVYSLFEWNLGESDILSDLLVSLKGVRHKKAWHYWARLFWSQRVLSLELDEPICFVPAPSTKPRAQDHAFLFAQALTEIAAGEMINPLRKVNQTHQRRASRALRSKVEVESSVKFADKEPGKRYILVDDVLTTGATAKACHVALGEPLHFEVWVLGKRGLSCEVSKYLL